MEKLDVVYIVKPTTRNEELRYSVRSVVKNFPYRNIIFVSGCPEDMSPDGYIPIAQHGSNKWKRTTTTLHNVCLDSSITEDFWLFNDDFFVMKQIKKLDPIYHGTLEDRVKEIKKGTGNMGMYAFRLKQTALVLKSKGYSTYNYAVHIPMLVNKHKALETMLQFPNEYMFRSLYGNYCSVGGRNQKDVKVNIIRGKEQKWDKRRRFLSTSNDSFSNGTVGVYIRTCFTEPSPYEIP